MLQPLAGQFVLQSRQGTHWHLDETRWPMFCLPQGQGRQLWWFWVVVSPEVTAFLLAPTRSGQVAGDFFPEGTQGIVSVDRYAGDFALLGRMVFEAGVLLVASAPGLCERGCERRPGAGLGRAVGELINQLFGTNARRRQAWFQGPSAAFGPLD